LARFSRGRADDGDGKSPTVQGGSEGQGLAQFNIWANRKQIPELKALFEMLAADPQARVVSIAIQDGATGRMRGVKIG